MPEVLAGDRERVLAVLDKFDAVFAVIADHDAEPTGRVEWAQSQGLAGEGCSRTAGGGRVCPMKRSTR
jgi:hypothetical protein